MTTQRYALEFAPKAIRSLGKLDRPIAQRIKAAAEALRSDPRPPGARMLTGMHGVLRVRVAKDYRILYTINDDRLVVLVVDAGHRLVFVCAGAGEVEATLSAGKSATRMRVACSLQPTPMRLHLSARKGENLFVQFGALRQETVAIAYKLASATS